MQIVFPAYWRTTAGYNEHFFFKLQSTRSQLSHEHTASEISLNSTTKERNNFTNILIHQIEKNIFL